MAEGKKSFIAYSDWWDVFKELDNENAGVLIKHIFSYVNDENPELEDKNLKACFALVRSTLKRDLQKWNKQLEQRSKAGKASAEARATKSNDRSTNVDEPQRNPTDSVSVNVNVNDSVFHISDLNLKFENLKKDKATKSAYARYKYSDQKYNSLIDDFYQNCLEKQYTKPYSDLVGYLSNFHRTWKPSSSRPGTVNYHQPL